MTPISLEDFQTTGGRRARSAVARWLFLLASAATVAVSALIVWTIASEAWTFGSQVARDQLQTIGWFPRRGLFDLSTLLVNSAQISLIAMFVAVPSGLGAAIYLSEYAHPKVRRVMKPTLELLASVPSVVLGVFAISFITPAVLSQFFDDINFFNILAAGLGARKVSTTLRVVIPAAISGLMAAIIVGFSRAIGETMVVTIASGGGDTSLFDLSLKESGGTITSAMAALGLGTDQVAGNDLAFQSLYFLGALLFLITLVLNIFGNAIVRRMQERY